MSRKTAAPVPRHGRAQASVPVADVARLSRRALLFLLFVALAAPMLTDLGLHLVLEQRASGFSVQSATILSLQELPASLDTGRRPRPQLEVRLALPWGGATRVLAVRLRTDEAADYARMHRPGEVVPVWMGAEGAMITPPLRLRLFEWFPYLHVPLAMGGFLLGLLALAIRSEVAQQPTPLPRRRRKLR